MTDQSAALLAHFIDSLWLEDGLSDNTLSAYRTDLSQFIEHFFQFVDKEFCILLLQI